MLCPPFLWSRRHLTDYNACFLIGESLWFKRKNLLSHALCERNFCCPLPEERQLSPWITRGIILCAHHKRRIKHYWIHTISIYVKVNAYTCRGTNSAIFIIGPPSHRCQLLKERICPYWCKLFPLRVDTHLERFCPSWRQTGSHKVISLLKRWQK